MFRKKQMLKIWLPLLLFMITAISFIAYPQKNKRSLDQQSSFENNEIENHKTSPSISWNSAPIPLFQIDHEPSFTKGYKDIAWTPDERPKLQIPQNWGVKNSENEAPLSIPLEETDNFWWLSTDKKNLKANQRLIPLDEPLVYTKPFDDYENIFFWNNNQQYHWYFGESEHRVYALHNGFSSNYALQKYPKSPDFKVLKNRKVLVKIDDPSWEAKNFPYWIDRSSTKQILSEGEFYMPGMHLSGDILTFFTLDSSAQVQVDGESLVYDYQNNEDILYDKNYNYILKYNYLSGIYKLIRVKR